MVDNAKRDQNMITTLIGVSNVDGITPVLVWVDPVTHRVLTQSGSGGTGTVTSVSVVTANGVSGSVATATTTPAITITLGAITPTSVNGLTISTTTGTFTLTNAKTLAVTNTLTFGGTDGSTIAFGTGGTVVYTTNNLSVFAATTSAQLAGVISDETGSGSLVFANTPTLVTPVLGVATATSINGLTITSSTGTLTITNAKTLSISNTLTFTGTDASSVAFGTGGTVAYVANKLSVFAATTSAELAGVISDETGSGALVFATSPTLTTPRFADLGFIADANGNELLIFDLNASAVNEITLTNAATGNAPQLAATGGDSNIDLKLAAKGTGKIAPQAPINHGAFTAYFTETDNGNSSTADTIDWTLSNKQKSTLTGNCTFTFTAPPGPCSLILKLVQDGTGSRTVTWPATVHWSGGTAPTLTTTASKVDIITFYWDGTTYFGNSTLNFTA